MYPPILKVQLKQSSAKDLSNDAYAIFCSCFFFLSFSIKAYAVGYSFELHQQVHANQMGTHNIGLYIDNIFPRKYFLKVHA